MIYFDAESLSETPLSFEVIPTEENSDERLK